MVVGPDGEVRQRLDLRDALLKRGGEPRRPASRCRRHGPPSALAGWRVGDATPLEASTAGWSASAAWDARSRSLVVADGRRVRVLDRSGAVRWSSPPLSSTVSTVLWPRGRRRVAAASYQA
jgi:hypothetical protein